MDALLLSFFLCLIIDALGNQSARAHHVLRRHGHSAASKAGIGLALALHAGLAAAAGFYIATLITPEARSLFFALTLAMAALSLFVSPKQQAPIDERGGAFAAGLAHTLIAGVGGSAQFVIAGIAAARADPWMAGLGGWLGSFAACLFVSGMLAEYHNMTRVKAARISSAILLLIIAFFIAMSALRLV